MTRQGTYRFETLNAAGGVCCGSNDPDFARCARCKTKPVNGHLRDAELRAAVPRDDGEFAPPDPYAAALIKLREEQGMPPAAPCPFSSPTYDPYGPPPNPYAAGIEKMRREKR